MTDSSPPPEDVDREQEEQEPEQVDEVDELQRQFDIAHDSPPPTG